MPIGPDTWHQTKTDEVGLLDYSTAISTLPAVQMQARADPGPIKDKTDVWQWSHICMFINPPNPRKMANLVFAPQATFLHHGMVPSGGFWDCAQL